MAKPAIRIPVGATALPSSAAGGFGAGAAGFAAPGARKTDGGVNVVFTGSLVMTVTPFGFDVHLGFSSIEKRRLRSFRVTANDPIAHGDPGFRLGARIANRDVQHLVLRHWPGTGPWLHRRGSLFPRLLLLPESHKFPSQFQHRRGA
jgi:hypothetical protein